MTVWCLITASLLQTNQAGAQLCKAAEAAAAAAADKARKEGAALEETKKSQEEAAQREQPAKEVAQTGADSPSEPAEHQTAAEAASGPAAAAEAASGPVAAADAAQTSAPSGDAAAQTAAASQSKKGIPAASLLSACKQTGTAAAEKAALPPLHLPWQSSQARH